MKAHFIFIIGLYADSIFNALCWNYTSSINHTPTYVGYIIDNQHCNFPNDLGDEYSDNQISTLPQIIHHYTGLSAETRAYYTTNSNISDAAVKGNNIMFAQNLNEGTIVYIEIIVNCIGFPTTIMVTPVDTALGHS